MHNIHYRDHGKGKVKIQHTREGDQSNGMEDINLDGGATSRYVSSTIMSNLDWQQAGSKLKNSRRREQQFVRDWQRSRNI